MNDLLCPQNANLPRKSHLFLNKFRRISSIDRDIRKKWSKMQQEKKQAEQKEFQQLISVQKIRHIKSQSLQNELQCSQSLPNAINKIRSEIIREQVHLRKKHYDDVFFKKRQKIYKLNLSPPIKLRPAQLEVSPARRIKTQNFLESPFPLQKRRVKKSRQLNIIERNFQEDMKAIDSKKRLETYKIFSDHKDWLNKYKGNKVYYKMVSMWQPPVE